MHRLNYKQKVHAVRVIKHLRNQPADKRRKQKDIAKSCGITQSQLSRYLKIYRHCGIVKVVDRTYCEGDKAQQYLAAWAVLLLS